MKDKMDRREFVKTSMALGVGAFAAPGTGIRLVELSDTDAPSERPSIEKRVLGRTKAEISAVSFGAMRCKNPMVLHRALDLGMNYIDTAHCYSNGKNEIMVGKVMKTRRKEAFLATKVHNHNKGGWIAKEDMIRSVEASLQSLQTDYVDLIQIHYSLQRC